MCEKTMYIAIEHNFGVAPEDYINDVGYPASSPEKAWEMVAGTFSAESTRIYTVSLYGTVSVVPAKIKITRKK